MSESLSLLSEPELDGYLRRIGYRGIPDGSPQALAELQSCHLQAVPYENFDILNGIPLSLEIPRLYEKIVNRGRGGYCFELNALFGWLLRELGYKVTDCIARFWRDESNPPPKPRHQVLIVEIGADSFLCDVGVGGIVPRFPLRLMDGAEQAQEEECYLLKRVPVFGWMLSERRRGQWREIYSFTGEPQLPKDFVMASFWCEHAPESKFKAAPIAAIRTSQGRNTLASGEFRIFNAAEVHVFSPKTRAAYKEALIQYFGIHVEPPFQTGEVYFMRAGLYIAPENVAAGNLEISPRTVNEARIKVSYAGICGTDMMIYAGKHPRAMAPLAMGHEFAGVVEAIGENGLFHIGDRVVIEPTLSCGRCPACASGQSHVCGTLKLIGIDKHGGFAEYVHVPVDRLHRIPDGLSDAHAALAEPVAVAFHAVRRSSLKLGDHVLLLGAGPIGLLIGRMAQLAGAAQVMISDISPFRLEIARSFGMIPLHAGETNIAAEVGKRTGGAGADTVFEVAGTQGTAQQMVQFVKTQGQIVVVSVYKQPPTVDLAAMHFREISLTTTRCYSTQDFRTAIQLMASGSLEVEPFISHILPLEEVAEGFRLMKNPEVSLKVLLQP